MRPMHKRKQSGITLIGFLLLAAVFGVVGLAGLKIIPLYLEKMSIGTVLNDLKDELATGGNNALGIRRALDSRFYVENLDQLQNNEINIKREGEGFSVVVNREKRVLFLPDLYFVLVINEQVEIAR
jgi:hypothetical protein